jgi:pimeloyl-ACP methyl ester carboxylesterase
MSRFDDVSFIAADDLHLVGMAAGPLDGAAVLLAHGGGQTHWAWRKTVDALAKSGFRATAIDLRGHGGSDRSPAADYHNEAFARDLLAVTDHLTGPVALVGASLGGIAGLVAEGALRPGSFTSLTLVDITPNPNMDGVARISGFMSAHVEDGFASLKDAAEAIGTYTKNREKRGPSESLARYLRLGEDGRYRWHWDPAFIAKFSGVYGEEQQQMMQAAKQLKLPVHLVRGGSSDLVTERDAADFIELVPHAEYTDIKGAGHMVVGDSNDAFSDAIISFLRRQSHSIGRD